eukprot:TRINITY_DN5127_c0_g1_i2.p1 TRINITY_DN5127_c0_g1~~TRINITY_DN5127_c0_g1_i2.p1  ORF type:complete len:1091 (+),score=238.50 TRINITY_DN5127_c0_g1_i2:127-3399(+)
MESEEEDDFFQAGAARWQPEPQGGPVENEDKFLDAEEANDERENDETTGQTRYLGAMKSVGDDYGFIECAATWREHGRDVYIGRLHFPSDVHWKVQQAVTFEVELNGRGRPQARRVQISELVPEPMPDRELSALAAARQTSSARNVLAVDSARRPQEPLTRVPKPKGEDWNDVPDSDSGSDNERTNGGHGPRRSEGPLQERATVVKSMPPSAGQTFAGFYNMGASSDSTPSRPSNGAPALRPSQQAASVDAHARYYSRTPSPQSPARDGLPPEPAAGLPVLFGNAPWRDASVSDDEEVVLSGHPHMLRQEVRLASMVQPPMAPVPNMPPPPPPAPMATHSFPQTAPQMAMVPPAPVQVAAAPVAPLQAAKPAPSASSVRPDPRKEEEFLKTVESEFARLAAAPQGAILAFPPLAPFFEAVLHTACVRQGFDVREESGLEGRQLFVSSHTATNPSGVLMPCPGLRIPVFSDLSAYAPGGLGSRPANDSAYSEGGYNSVRPDNSLLLQAAAAQPARGAPQIGIAAQMQAARQQREESVQCTVAPQWLNGRGRQELSSGAAEFVPSGLNNGLSAASPEFVPSGTLTLSATAQPFAPSQAAQGQDSQYAAAAASEFSAVEGWDDSYGQSHGMDGGCYSMDGMQWSDGQYGEMWQESQHHQQEDAQYWTEEGYNNGAAYQQWSADGEESMVPATGSQHQHAQQAQQARVEAWEQEMEMAMEQRRPRERPPPPGFQKGGDAEYWFQKGKALGKEQGKSKGSSGKQYPDIWAKGKELYFKGKGKDSPGKGKGDHPMDYYDDIRRDKGHEKGFGYDKGYGHDKGHPHEKGGFRQGGGKGDKDRDDWDGWRGKWNDDWKRSDWSKHDREQQWNEEREQREREKRRQDWDRDKRDREKRDWAMNVWRDDWREGRPAVRRRPPGERPGDRGSSSASSSAESDSASDSDSTSDSDQAGDRRGRRKGKGDGKGKGPLAAAGKAGHKGAGPPAGKTRPMEPPRQIEQRPPEYRPEQRPAEKQRPERRAASRPPPAEERPTPPDASDGKNGGTDDGHEPKSSAIDKSKFHRMALGHLLGGGAKRPTRRKDEADSKDAAMAQNEEP